MNRTFLSIVVVIAALAAFLVLQATNESSSEVMIPSQLSAADPSIKRSRIRVGGKVAELPVAYQVEPTFLLSFSIIDPGKGGDVANAVPVVYAGIKPDMFASGRDIIIDGNFENGTLTAVKLMTQCPSKYEPPSPDGKPPVAG